jgi:EAL domain-containing protein (putative c-di-GMP-specific phosphodiesterase class I)
MLLDAARRALAAPRGRLAIVLHLSRLRAPRAYHGRIARPVLDQAAARLAGTVYPRSNGDLLLLCQEPTSGDASLQPAALVQELALLFGAEGDLGFISLWHLGTEAAGFRAYLEEPAFAPPILPAAAEEVTPAQTAAMAEWLKSSQRIPVPDLLGQQTAVELHAGRDVPIGSRLSPLFREFVMHLPGGAAGMDPWLERHVAAALDERLLAHLQHDLEEGGRLTRASVHAGLAIHINLALPSIASPAFGRLTQAARAAGARLGVEISIVEAFADLSMLDYAAGLLRHAGFAFVLEGLDEASMGFARLGSLGADLIKLDWSQGLVQPPGPRRRTVEGHLQALGLDRVLLQRADTADAVGWGQANGINRYQGAFLDSVQGATRMFHCHTASLCSLKQCVARGAAAGTQGRTGCSNPALLDLPPEAPPSADSVRGALASAAVAPMRVPAPAHRW